MKTTSTGTGTTDLPVHRKSTSHPKPIVIGIGIKALWWFTLVELIVVITILVILGTIAFTQLGGFAGSARDSARISNLTNLKQWLDLYQIKSGTYPMPESSVTIMASGVTIGYQGFAGDVVALLAKLSPRGTTDPSDATIYTTYTVNLNQSKMQAMVFLEDSSTVSAFVSSLTPTANASTTSDYSKRYPMTIGDGLGILIDSSTGATKNQPIQELYNTTTFTGVDIARTSSGYRAYFSKSDTIEGTGIILQNLQISYAAGVGYNSPTNCPTGFIAVPGNKDDFKQPGFCVAKYEMKYTSTSGKGQCGKGTASLTQCNNGVADATDRWNSWAWTAGNTPVSIPQGEPIAGITQSGAIAACQSMGAGYHLITNNEWMTIARNIEQQPDNWSTGITGSGFLYSGNNDDGGWTNSWALPASTDDTDGYYMTQDSAAGNGDTNKVSCNATTDTCGKGQKRTLKLSNGQTIWDLAGNVWEHVNGENSINPTGTGYASLSGNACGTQGWFAFSTGAIVSDGMPTCNYQPSSYSYQNQWPKIQRLNATNGIGCIFSYPMGGTNRVFLRGGGSNGAHAGVFALHFRWDALHANRTVGFRCAR